MPDVRGEGVVPGRLGTAELLDVFLGSRFGEVHEQVDGFVMVVLAAGLLGRQVLQDRGGLLAVEISVVLGVELEFSCQCLRGLE